MNREKAISKVVRGLLLSKDMKVQDVEKHLPFGTQSISNLLNNRNKWDIHKVYLFAELFGIDGSEILIRAESLIDMAESLGSIGESHE
jgi:hypothetical protein